MSPSPVAVRTLFAAAVALCLPVSAAGQAVVNPDSALAMTLDAMEGEFLTLESALERALGHDTRVVEARAEVRAASGTLRSERGAFDPVLFADITWSDRETPTASPFAGADVLQDESRFGTAGARLKLPFGTELEASLQSTRLETNSEFAALNPQNTAVGLLQVTQPLLRGFGSGSHGARSAARRDWEASRSRLMDARLRVEADVISTYWNLYATERDLAVQRVIVDQATAFLEQARQRADVGLVGPNEVATATVFLTEQQLAVIDDEERLEEVSDHLATLLGRPATHGSGRFRSVSEPSTEPPVETESALVARALAHNGELEAARQELEARRAEAAAARWNALPRLDLVGSIGGNGLTGVAQPVVFGADTTFANTGTGFSKSVTEALRRNSPTWSIGVTLELPIALRTGRGEHERTLAEVVRAEQQVLARERELREAVRARHRELRHGVRRLALARVGVDASLEQVRVGLVEYENGRTTAFELVRLGADLAAAQKRYSDALVRTAQAAAELRRLAPPEPLEEE